MIREYDRIEDRKPERRNSAIMWTKSSSCLLFPFFLHSISRQCFLLSNYVGKLQTLTPISFEPDPFRVPHMMLARTLQLILNSGDTNKRKKQSPYRRSFWTRLNFEQYVNRCSQIMTLSDDLHGPSTSASIDKYSSVFCLFASFIAWFIFM